MASGNYSNSEQSFNGFNSDDINDHHDNSNELNDSDLDISSIQPSDSDDGQSDIDISSVESSDDNDDTASESSIQSTGENDNDDGEWLVTYDPVWTTDLENFEVPYFTSYTGSLMPPDFDCQTSHLIDYFRLFYTQYLADLLVTHTNSYHAWCVENKQILTPDYKDKLWYNVTSSEMQAHLGLNILFGLSPSACTRDYWSSDAFLGNTFVKNMPEKQFEKITQYLHCSDRRSKPPKGTLNFDRLYKIREFITSLSKTFQQYQSPSKYCAIDEAMVRSM